MVRGLRRLCCNIKRFWCHIIERLQRWAIAAGENLLRRLQRRYFGRWRSRCGSPGQSDCRRQRPGLTHRRPTELGFILPTTTLLLLIVSLSVGAMVLRAYDQAAGTGRDRQRQVVVNAASPAADRAKAKLDYLFDRRSDPRLPVGVPHQDRLQQMLLNQSEPRLALAEPPTADPYTFPDETRLDIDGDGALDNAWRYRTGEDGDALDSGAPNNSATNSSATVVYGIWLRQPSPGDTPSAAERAYHGLVRHGPLSAEEEPLCRPRYAGLAEAYAAAGWRSELDHPSRYRKNIQIDVYVLPDRAGSVTTLELQQERQVYQGFPWGAWFQDDLELSSEEPLVINGALHTQGSLIVDSDDAIALLPASTPASCLSDASADRLTTGRSLLNEFDNRHDRPQHNRHARSRHEGYGIAGSIDRDRFGGRATLYDRASATAALTAATDALESGAQHPTDLLLDPLEQLTAARQTYRGGNLAGQRHEPPDRIATRLYPKHQDLPLTADRFRADDRYGPAPVIGGRLIPGKIGEPIVGDRLLDGPVPLSDARLTRNALDQSASAIDESTWVGLDGYWERRARAEGLRLIVGQRLQLGASTPPWPGCPSSARQRCHEARQRRSLQDVLAAVQSTLIYPAHAPEPDRPAACLLSTVHPGTAATLTASSTFIDRATLLKDVLPPGFYTGKPILSDLFRGRGTNGWEYDALPATVRTEADFERAIAANRPLGQALRNLAHFAGDPLGGSPSFTPADNALTEPVHPYPLLAAWGDFSLLRRILTRLDRPGATSYRQLSPADKTTLHSAACSLGILAYNVGYLSQMAYPTADAAPDLLRQLIDALSALPASSTALNAPALDAPEAALSALRRQTGVPLEVIALAETIALKEQVHRDRRQGFAAGRVESGLDSLDAALQRLIPAQPAFPALQYLFPLPHETAAGQEEGSAPPWRARYIVPRNQGWRYRTLDLTDDAVLQEVAIAPRPLSNWQLPHTPESAGAVLSDRALYLSCEGAACSGSPGRVRLAVKDAALFDGREMLLARVLDLDLDLLRQSQVGGRSWLPDSGIVYGFREDAVGEDGITRPARQTWSTCSRHSALTNPGAGCRTGAAAASATDPPLSDRAISPKPVDGIPDPDRRPYGFRLRNGARLARGGHAQGLSFITDNPAYVMGPFNLHQKAGCQGNCSLAEFRELLPSNRLYGPREFYRRHSLDPRFADPRQDDWRASEIVADSVTVLSEQFCDGSVEDGWVTAGLAQPRLPHDVMAAYGCRNRDRRTSFLNQNRPRSRPPAPAGGDPWQRAVAEDLASPIVISAQGNPVLKGGTDYAGNYGSFRDPKPLIRAQPQSLNAVIVSGMVPSIPRQASGGLVDQLRRLENWETVTFSGAWVQLGYSRYSTAPFDQDAWETGRPKPARYDAYQALARPHWRYDVALQYGTAPPFVRPLETVAANPRSEFYSIPAAADPYIAILCRAAGGGRCR
ncbi:MAG: hypothetical protein ACFB5Z_00205 [Elainellaceae cyanobacterium]